MKKITIIALAVTLLAACSKDNMEINPDSTAQNSSTSSVQKALVTRAFSANISAVADPTSPPTSCSGVIPFAAPDFILSGNAIHLGQLNGLSRLHHVSCDVDVNTALLTTNVSGQIVAANGDVINYTGDDVVNIASLLTQTGTTGAITGTWTITGGSGRFEGATGTLTINGIVDLVGGSFTCDCVGTITY
jgi:hypothetical protein